MIDIVKDLKTMAANIAKIEAEARKMREDAVIPFLDQLAALGTVSVITIRGSTPGFNDGEPCVHSQDIFVNGQGHFDGYDLIDEGGWAADLEEDFVPEYHYNSETRTQDHNPVALEANRAGAASIGHIWDLPDQGISSAIEMILGPHFDQLYDTNYYVQITFKDGKPIVDNGHYDCGY